MKHPGDSVKGGVIRVLSQFAGSLWDPNITACKKNEKTVEVNFTTNPLGNRYMVLIRRDTMLGVSIVLEVLSPLITSPVPTSSFGIVKGSTHILGSSA